MTTKKPSPNDDRSNVKNPNNPAYDADKANRSRPDQGRAQPAQPPAKPAPPPKR